MKIYKEGAQIVISKPSFTDDIFIPSRDTLMRIEDNNIFIVDRPAGISYDGDFSIIKNATAEVKASGTVTLTGGVSGSVNGITVNAIEIMSGETFVDTLDNLATAVALNITNNTSTPNYTATASTNIITITDATDTEVYDNTTSNAYAVVSSTTTVTTTDGNLASGVTALVGNLAAVRAYLSPIISS